jgi:hypothetical protein
MVALVDRSPFGHRAPGPLDRAVLGMTGSMPANWLGLRLAIGLRRLTTMRHRDALDVERWGLRLRLYHLGVRTCSHCSRRAATLRLRAVATTSRCDAGESAMAEAVNEGRIGRMFDRTTLERFADWLAVVVAMPWGQTVFHRWLYALGFGVVGWLALRAKVTVRDASQ